MKSDAHVLIVSKDPILLETRKLILEAFFLVEAADGVSCACTLMARRTFDLVVLCYTLSDDECQQVIGLAHEQEPRPKVLTLNALGHHCTDSANGHKLMAGDGPSALVKKSAELLGFDLEGSGHLIRG
ncbi:MAG: hypothetical protein WBQ94_08470 [Terracidiphilus sp.]